MIEMKVELYDWDATRFETVTLPCCLSEKLDMTHEYQITGGDGINLTCYELEDLNNALDEIASANPLLTAETLMAIMEASGSDDLTDEEFLRKMTEEDYMLELVYDDWRGRLSPDEECAWFLAAKQKIPFAKNITPSNLDEMDLCPEAVDWTAVWDYYERMGFKSVEIDGELFVLNWNNA